MNQLCNPVQLLWLATALICAPVTCAIGKTSDKDQPVVVTADRSEYSDELQRQTLTGNVLIVQGSLRIHADEIVIGLVQGALDSVDAKGRPATFKQLDDKGQSITGEAARVLYTLPSDQLLLLGDAVLSTPSKSLSGERIEYNIDTQSASAEGGDKQVSIVIQPVKKETQ